MDHLSLIQKPITSELNNFDQLFIQSLTHTDGLLSQALYFIRQRTGKRMRPMLILLMAKNFGTVTDVAQNAAVGLELLHTASLVHDDVVDESAERRGQASVNAMYDNKVAVLVGDYILSTALLYVSFTHSETIIRNLANLGRMLSNGEILQLTNIQNEDISEAIYYQVIKQKTAALFESCAVIGAHAAKAMPEEVEAARRFGQNLGIIFQIRDDIFDYYTSSVEVGKPTGNDMAEGKLTLPVIHALKTCPEERMLALAAKVKENRVSTQEIEELIAFTKAHNGIEYAEKRMYEFRDKALSFIHGYVRDEELKQSFKAYLDFVIERKS